MSVNKDNIQGDVWSKGFPKYNETYYFFSIAKGKEKDFSKCLKKLATKTDQALLISTLTVAQDDQRTVAAAASKADKVPLSNALIAFTRKGLDTIELAFPSKPTSLDLDNVKDTDPAFYRGMAADQTFLKDPPIGDWDKLFKSESTPIHGMLKVAGSDKDQVEIKLQAILKVLQHGTVTLDVAETSPPMTEKSRINGNVRPKERGLNGKEHFGFEDGISQPLIDGIDTLETPVNGLANMNTDANIIIVSDSSFVSKGNRPAWMNDGTFLVFRKLEQHVKEFNALLDTFATHDCTKRGQMGAKLMGRWESGAPVASHPDDLEDKKTAKTLNSFKYTNDSACPLSAHTRKTNPRETDTNNPQSIRARIVRNGIPYGSEFSDKPGEARGLLFACYQSRIEDGFRFIQQAWANNVDFPERDAGHDPIIGQSSDRQLSVTITNAENLPRKLPPLAEMVTLKGGDYFFVPSISALQTTLGQD